MAVVTDKEKGTTVQQIQLHSNQAVCMPWQVVKGNSLAKVHCSFIEGLPVQGKLESLINKPFQCDLGFLTFM
jgi:hypothetical protein